MARLQDALLPGCLIDETPGFVRGGGDWLFDQHVQPGRQQGLSHLRVR